MTTAITCLKCGATESYDECRNRKTGKIERIEAWYPLRDRRTDEIIAYQCQTCWDQ